MRQPVTIPTGRVWAWDTPERILIQIDLSSDPNTPGRNAVDSTYRTRRIVVGDSRWIQRQLAQAGEPWPNAPPQAGPEEIPRLVVPTLDSLRGKDPVAHALFESYGRCPARTLGDLSQSLGNLFLRMLKMVSIPLIITSLLSGVLGLGQVEQLGKMFSRTLLYYLSTSMLAIVVGLLMVNVIRPGLDPATPSASPAVAQEHTLHHPARGPDRPEPKTVPRRPPQGKGLAVILFEQLQNMIPPNPFQAIAQGNFLSIIAFSLAFGVCTLLVGGAAAASIRELAEAAFQVMMKMTLLIICLAPIGVFFLMLSATATQGAGIFSTLGWYMLTVATALSIHALVILPAILYLVARRSPLRFAQAMSPALLTAFSSASSNGTLPLTLTCVEQRAGVSNRVGSFVLPLGATINMDGTALYEVVAVLFIAQQSGIDLALPQQLIVAFTALLASIGAAGIPHAGLVMMVIILQAVGLPTESQGLIIAVDRVLDMARTAVNVWSDSCGTAVVSHFETVGSSRAAP
jgi:Na+/H+-dicarboxylate symporter